MKKKWVIKETKAEQVILPEYPAIVGRLLALRGLTTEESISEFLNPDYTKLYDPFIFQDMKKACARIWQAIENREKIVIYADYDADAITACSVMYLSLKKLGGIVDYYIPDRFTEGYGINQEAIKKIKDDGAGLVITVDCGINAVEETGLCNSLGMDIVITDHHELTGELPAAYSIINPKNPHDKYPFPYLTGVGVAYKLVIALYSDSSRLQSKNIPIGWEKWLMDFVAIGTVADLQSLTSENRTIVSFGLKVLNKTRWPGIKALLDAAGIYPGKLDTYSMGFIIAPRINAAGRIKHADIAFRLLISENILEAQNLAIELNDLNSHRQMLTEQILSEARAQVELTPDKKVLLAAGQNWPKGVVGLVAGKLVEEFGKPVLVMEKGESMATGSGRSTSNFDLVAALTYAKPLLSKYGGHTQAAGFTLPVENIDSLHQKLLEYAEAHQLDNTEPVLELDAELMIEQINWDTYGYLERFAPFGFGNPKPKFASYNFVINDYRLIGAQNQHLKLKVGKDGKYFDAIAFRQGFLFSKIKPGMKIDLAYELDCNEWNGSKDLQLKIIDIIFHEA